MDTKKLRNAVQKNQTENGTRKRNSPRSSKSESSDESADDTYDDPTYEISDLEKNNEIHSSNSSPSDTDSDTEFRIPFETPHRTFYVRRKLNFDDLAVLQSPAKKSDSFASTCNSHSPKKASENIQVEKLNPSAGRKKKKTFCQFCKLDVTNFERHLERNHKDYKEVREMLKFEKKSKERKECIGLLRNTGNFEEYLKGNVRPVYLSKKKSDTQHFPCAYCKGLYSKQYLYRHHKKCRAAQISESPKKNRHLSASQTLIACTLDKNNTLHKLRVKEEVFDIMKADKISMAAKTDTLICYFGDQYLKKHKRQQMAVVCSNKMRELARLLLEIREIQKKPDFQLIDAIDPSMFDTVIECAKRVGGYNSITKIYRAPSLSAHLGTSLKQACDLLIRLIHKQSNTVKCSDPDAKLKSTKRFRDLIASQWTTEISSLAFKDLNEKKWNKPIILPLTKDVLTFKNYVTQIANEAVEALQADPNNAREYKNLVSATLALTILYNRRRIGDVQYTKLQTYLNNFATSNQEELIESLSISEKILTKQYKRVVTGGKGSRPIVILFPQNLQDYMDVVLNIRLKTNLVSQSNEFLFAHPGSDRWVRGDVVIRQFAQKCNIKHPDHISSNKLRKQIATVMQILNLNPEETDQFAQFMGHTGKTHDEFYRLPQDVYQTAKVSKLLILMDKGNGKQFVGKSLNEIEINPEVDQVESEDSENEETVNVNTKSRNFVMESPNLSASSTKKPLKKKQVGRTVWTSEQAKVVKSYFKHHLHQKKAPKKTECEKLKMNHPNLLENKDWIRIKTFVYNVYRNK